MRCATCGHENPAGTKFCSECGHPLAATCPVCATPNPPGNKFCSECGTSLTAPSALEPAITTPGRTERRVVSVLFADLVGFTPFSESRDPEEVRAMLTRYFERSREIVARFHGSVEKFIGDAVMAWWGAVGAQEDDAERAVRAALELVDMVSNLGTEIGVPGLALRAGVLTGETSVGPAGSEQGLLVGDLVNTASRLQSVAAPGTVIVGESTARLVASAVETQPLGEQVLKGKELPVKAFRAVRVVAQRGGKGRADGIEPPFTGRHDELRLLKDQLHAGTREQRGRLVSVIGEAGIGKSRLAWELAKYSDGIGDVVYWHHGRSPAYGDGIALWSIGEMIRGRAGIVSEADDRAKARMKLRTAIAEWLPVEEERRWVEPRLAALLGLDEAPPGDRSELFAAIRTFFHRIAERSTVVMVFEDLHWADDGVLEFIEDLIERSTRHPILVITLSRPELLERHPAWGSGRRNTLSIHLAPLSDGDMGDLITGMAPGIPPEAVRAIIARAGGIPLYAVEFVRMLLASGDLARADDGFTLTGPISDLAVPDTLAAVIGARLDRLDQSDRELVQDAAVLGQSFTLPGLAAVRGVTPSTLVEPLRALVRHEVFELDEDARSAERGQYRFVQGLIREVAYARLSRSDRHLRHRRVAEHFAGLGESELAGIVASHFLAAHETAPPGSEDLLARGRTALLEAARRTASLQASAQALGLFRQALELTPDPASRGGILIAAAEAAMGAGETEEALSLAGQAVAVLDQSGDPEGALRAHATVSATLNAFYRSNEAVAHLRPVFDTIADFDTWPRVAVGLEMVRAHMLNDEVEEAVIVAERVMPHAERLAPVGAVIHGIISKATALTNLGRHLEGQAGLAGAIALADARGLHEQAMRALNNLTDCLYSTDPMEAMRAGEELYERAIKFSGTAWLDRQRFDLASFRPLAGQFQGALDLLDNLDPAHLSPIMAAIARCNRLIVGGYIDPSPGVGDSLRAELDSAGDIGDPQMADYAGAIRAISYALDRDWVRSLELHFDLRWPLSVADGVATAVRIGDASGIRRALARLDEEAPLISGDFGGAVGRFGRGALAILEDDREGGVAAMVDALQQLAEVIPPLHLADAQTALATLVGLDHPAVRAAAEAADAWIRSVGAYGLAHMWAEGLPAPATDRRLVG